MSPHLDLKSLPALGAAIQGGIYAAFLNEAKTGRPYMLMSMGKVGDRKTWEQSGELQPKDQSRPNKVEGMALYAASLVDEPIWLDEPYDSLHAWVQHPRGLQDVYDRNYKFAAVSVRRLFLDSFDPSQLQEHA